ncbi:hypothetical protein A2335_00950 [Candidatus Peregrinibacteria bacterium RIFOXYB2_FULL_32_7]|nr:MAG: hypothetical protein A2335_00950 [Candidatus Peregrinibacteria bacterium RIFOXYB2_FULL_32_7]
MNIISCSHPVPEDQNAYENPEVMRELSAEEQKQFDDLCKEQKQRDLDDERKQIRAGIDRRLIVSRFNGHI